MQERVFIYDVFLSHSTKDKAVVRPLAERASAPRQGERESSSDLSHR